MKSRKWALWTLGPALLLVGGVVALAAADHALCLPRSFDAERWRDGDARARSRMVGDLNRGRVLLGKTRDEVLALLGPADRENTGGQLEYELVSSFGFGFAEFRSWLWIRFDGTTGRVGEVTFFD